VDTLVSFLTLEEMVCFSPLIWCRLLALSYITIPASLRWNQLDRGIWSFWYAVEFDLSIFFPLLLYWVEVH
jgi:hypothetical protein